MVDGLERMGRNAQAHAAPERIGNQGDAAQIGQEPPLGLAVRVAHLVTDLCGLAGQFATPRHGPKSL